MKKPLNSENALNSNQLPEKYRDFKDFTDFIRKIPDSQDENSQNPHYTSNV